MRILYLSQYFPPEIGAPAMRVSELARRWHERGHDVTVLTGFPSHPTGVVAPGYRGRVFMRERWHGVEVLRTWIYATANAGVLRRSLAYGSFAASSVASGTLLSAVREADVIIATSPQFLCGLSGWALARLWKVPFVFEVRDLWPQSIVEVGAMSAGHPVVAALRRLEALLYAKADLLVGVTESFANIWRRAGIDANKIRVITNGVDLSRFHLPLDEATARADLGLHGKFVVSYVGTIGLAHGVKALLDVAQRMSHRRDIVFLIVGTGAQRKDLESEARHRRLGNVRIFGPVVPERVPEVLAATDLAVVMLRNTPLFATVLPSKLFEIMACAKPVMLAVEGEARRLVDKAGCGYIAAPEDVSSMVSAIEQASANPQLARERGMEGRRFVEQHFDRDRLADAYLRELEQLVDRTTT